MNFSDIPFYYKCKTCGQKGTTQAGTPACAKFKIAINPEEDFCAWHTNENVTGCIFCGASENLIIEEIDGENYLFCANHYQAFHGCQGCANFKVCAFEADRSEPQFVMKTIRQGMMTMQTQIRNPNLVRKHCLTCRCCLKSQGNDDPTCLKNSPDLACSNWQPQKALLQQYSQ